MMLMLICRRVEQPCPSYADGAALVTEKNGGTVRDRESRGEGEGRDEKIIIERGRVE